MESISIILGQNILIIGVVLFAVISTVRNLSELITLSQKPAAPSPTPTKAPVKVVKKSFAPIDVDCLLHHTSWASNDLTAEQDAIYEVFAANGMPYHTEKIIQGTSLTRIVYTLENMKDYNRISRLEKQFRAALNKPEASISVEGKYINIDFASDLDDTLYIGDMLRNDTTPGAIPIGRSADGQDVFADIEDLKHILVAGASGSGKSVWVQGMILSLLAKHKDLELYMIDPKVVEFNRYRAIHNCHVVTEADKAADLLKNICNEMDRRYIEIAKAGARDITGVPGMKRIIVIVDELADLMCSGQKKQIETCIVRLAQKARACGIHLVLATQYPKSDIVTGLIKTNMPTKICFAVPTTAASCVMLGKGGAEKLIGKGDMLYQTEKDIMPRRLQGAMVSDNDLDYILSMRA
ncbi:MAG: hypothetical protein IKN54_02260 [Lachnospiraceae bacterium]|nr:hypothetical protein [Lachnospiraceae bacterium]